MGIACADAVLVVEREWMAAARGEDFDEFAHFSMGRSRELWLSPSPVRWLTNMSYWMQISCHISGIVSRTYLWDNGFG